MCDNEAQGGSTELGAEARDGLCQEYSPFLEKTKVQIVLVNRMELLLRFWVFTEKIVASSVEPGSHGAKAIGFRMNPPGISAHEGAAEYPGSVPCPL